MKLSEAMRIGIAATKPVHGPYFERRAKDGTICGACALGAVAIGLGAKYVEALERFGGMYEVDALPRIRELHCPSDGSRQLRSQVTDAFEVLGMSREAIADALEEAGL